MVEEYFKSHREDGTKHTIKTDTNYELCRVFIHLYVPSSALSFSKYLLSAYYVLKFLC